MRARGDRVTFQRSVVVAAARSGPAVHVSSVALVPGGDSSTIQRLRSAPSSKPLSVTEVGDRPLTGVAHRDHERDGRTEPLAARERRALDRDTGAVLARRRVARLPAVTYAALRRSVRAVAGEPEEPADGPQRRRSSVSPGEDSPRGDRGHVDPHRADDHVRAAASVLLWRRVRQPVFVRAEVVLVSPADLHDRLRIRRARPAGGELPRPVRRVGPARGVLRAGRDPRVRAVRDRDRARGRGGHRDHGGPRRPQDPRGARRAAGAGRRHGQEHRRATFSGADARLR